MCVGNSIHLQHTNGCSCESVKVFEAQNVLTWGGLEPPTFGFMQNALTYWVIINIFHELHDTFVACHVGNEWYFAVFKGKVISWSVYMTQYK